MANVQYGDTFQLRCLGYETSVADTPAGGYLAFDDAGKAVTTATPLATWKFESPDGKKKGEVMIGDIVRIVNTGPNPPYPKARDLQCKYPAETGFNDVAVTVSWALKPPSGAVD
jgi:hypothetical protein